MKKRQLTGVLLCAALAAGMLAGCGQKAGTTETAGGQTAAESQKETQGEKKAKGVTITVGLKASHVEISNIETFKKGWEEATGNTVDVQAIDDDQFDSLLQTKMSTNGKWDIFIGDTGTQAASYQHAKNLVDL
ncbi:MAG: carbohydrate ABC transporter substrate-binding protein, partial [Hungatella sp.]